MLAQSPCLLGLCWVWSPHGPPSCGQAHSCSPFIILTSRRDPINHNTSFANVTSLCGAPPGREPQPSRSGWVKSGTAVWTLQTHSRASGPRFQAPGIGPRGLLSMLGSPRLSCKISSRKLSGGGGGGHWGDGQGPLQLRLEGCKIPAPLPEASSEFYFLFV